MSVLTVKRVGLSAIGITAVGGIVKAVISTSPSSVIPLAEAENFVVPTESQDNVAVKRRVRRDSEQTSLIAEQSNSFI